MKIYLTFDYELYFGAQTGTAERCMVSPTAMLSEMAEKYGIRLCQFVDVGYLIALERQRRQFKQLEKDYSIVCRQLEHLYARGHDLQLHIHPHWEDSHYDGEKWICDIRRYRLADFDDAGITDIVHRYHARLEQFTGTGEVFAYRAGGWCIEPFQRLKPALRQVGIRVDSSVFANGHYQSSIYQYDFRGAPDFSRWTFEDDPMQPTKDGGFTELPIGSIRNSPLFYWRLFLLGRMRPYQHKPLGDGQPVPAPGQRRALLSRYTYNTVSVDGYNARLLNRARKQHLLLDKKELVVIGHPKALSRYGLRELEAFISQHRLHDTFTTFRAEKNSFL